MPAARSGASGPLSVAATAGGRMAVGIADAKCPVTTPAAHSASGALGFVLRFTGSLNAADDTFLPKTSAVPSR
jgi:hypothetical protein